MFHCIWIYHAFIFYFLATYPNQSANQFIQPGLCDGRCHCPKDEGVVHCDRQDRLLGVPTNLPLGVTKLYIQQSNFPIPNYLSRANMTGLENLEYLQIIYCNLQVIEPRTFIGMTKLKQLDLSYNSLVRLESFTFSGLHLSNLYLNEQHLLANDPSLYISEDAFHNLIASQINLRGNRLSSIIYETFAKVTHLDRLILSENHLTQIGNEFQKYFDHPNRLLDLTGNPLVCNCRLAWIALRSSDWGDSLPGLNMTCVYYSPQVDPNLTNQKHVFELNKLSADQLCPTSRIKHIWIDVMDDARKAVISCTAETIPRQSNYLPESGLNSKFPQVGVLSHAPPGVAWRYIEAGQLREVRRLSSTSTNDLADDNITFDLHNSSAKLAIATVQLNVVLDSLPRKYTCATWDDKKETEEVVVTLKGPNLNFIPPTPNNTLVGQDRIRNRLVKPPYKTDKDHLKLTNVMFEQPHYLFQKQFTLLEMTGSVIGTFLATLIFLLIGARCLRMCQQHNSLFRLTPSCSSILASDSKGIYLGGKAIKTEPINHSDPGNTSRKPLINGGIVGSTFAESNGTFYNPQNQNHQYNPHIMLPGLNSAAMAAAAAAAAHGNFLSHLNLTNPYLGATGTLPSMATAPSSSTGTDELQSSLALLTSTPLIHSSKLRTLMANDGSALSPFMTPNQMHFNQWPVTPGSPYSISGSHEYDIPRVLDFPHCTPSMGTINQTCLLNGSEQMNFSDLNFLDPQMRTNNIN